MALWKIKADSWPRRGMTISDHITQYKRLSTRTFKRLPPPNIKAQSQDGKVGDTDNCPASSDSNNRYIAYRGVYWSPAWRTIKNHCLNNGHTLPNITCRHKVWDRKCGGKVICHRNDRVRLSTAGNSLRPKLPSDARRRIGSHQENAYRSEAETVFWRSTQIPSWVKISGLRGNETNLSAEKSAAKVGIKVNIFSDVVSWVTNIW